MTGSRNTSPATADPDPSTFLLGGRHLSGSYRPRLRETEELLRSSWLRLKLRNQIFPLSGDP